MACNVDINSPNVVIPPFYISCASLNKENFVGHGAANSQELMDQIIAAYGASVSDFEIIAGVLYVRLTCREEDYKPEYIYPKGEPSFDRSFTIQTFHARAYSYGAEIKIASEKAYLYYILDEIRRSTLSSDKRSQSTIMMIDCVLPDPEDFREEIADTVVNACTYREAVLRPIQAGSGLVGRRGKRAMKGGFTIKFEQLKLRV